MVFSDQTYSVLVVSAAQKFNEAFAAMLPGSEYYPVRFVGNIAAARREMVNKTYDLVIINAPLPDDFGTRFAIDACNQSGTVALLLAKSDVYDEMEAKLTCQGVFTLAKPTSAEPKPEMARFRPGTVTAHGGKGHLRGRKNGRNPSGEPGKVAAHRAAENDRGRSPPSHRKAGHGSLHDQTGDRLGNHQDLRMIAPQYLHMKTLQGKNPLQRFCLLHHF